MHKHSSLALADDARRKAIASLRAYSAENFDDELTEAALHKREFPVSGKRKR